MCCLYGLRRSGSSIRRIAYPTSAALANMSFCAKLFGATSAKSLLVHNRTADDGADLGNDQRVKISWNTGPTLYDYASATPIERCENISTGTLWTGCRYVSHANDSRTWQLSAWSFAANSLSNEYTSNFASRILLGPTFRKDAVASGPIWHNFGGETNATNAANDWVNGLAVGDLYLRDDRCMDGAKNGDGPVNVHRWAERSLHAMLHEEDHDDRAPVHPCAGRTRRRWRRGLQRAGRVG